MADERAAGGTRMEAPSAGQPWRTHHATRRPFGRGPARAGCGVQPVFEWVRPFLGHRLGPRRRSPSPVGELRGVYGGERARAEARRVASVFAEAVSFKDLVTGEHARAVERLAPGTGPDAGLRGDELEASALGALPHDVGKISVPDAVLG
ncbi:MAG: hypothetical protein M3R38_10150, partial [Actinomycetota bacterium]|nr:hypothetical protein [Actinomycetota bacterium]